MTSCTVYHQLGRGDERGLETLRNSGLPSYLANLQMRKLHDRIKFEESVDSKADEFLPQPLRHLGFRRLKSVFATPHPPQTRKRTVELIVEGEQCLVLPMGYYTSADCNGSLDDNFIRLYWLKGLMLEEFLRQYEFNPHSNYGEYGLWWENRANGFLYDQPEIIFMPEAIREFRRILPPSKEF